MKAYIIATIVSLLAGCFIGYKLKKEVKPVIQTKIEYKDRVVEKEVVKYVEKEVVKYIKDNSVTTTERLDKETGKIIERTVVKNDIEESINKKEWSYSDETIKEQDKTVSELKLVSHDYKHLINVELSSNILQLNFNSLNVGYSYMILKDVYLGGFVEIPFEYQNLYKYKAGVSLTIRF